MNRHKDWNAARKWALALLAPVLLTAAVRAAELPEVPASGAQTEPEKPESAEMAGLPAPLPPELPAPPEDAKEPEGAEKPEGAKEPVEPVFPEAEDWQLLLVNPWNPLPEDFRETLVLKSLPNGLRVDRRAYGDLTEMLSDCRRAGLRPLVCSAYRTQATQIRLYNNKIVRLLAAGYPVADALTEAGRWVAAPGTSEHQTGLAVDIVAASYQLLDEDQAETAEQKWLMEHCWEYGFILRYPSEKSEVTGIGYEPWHYRYVGRAAALDIRDSGLCLEEYLEQRARALAPREASEPEAEANGTAE